MAHPKVSFATPLLPVRVEAIALILEDVPIFVISCVGSECCSGDTRLSSVCYGQPVIQTSVLPSSITSPTRRSGTATNMPSAAIRSRRMHYIWR